MLPLISTWRANHTKTAILLAFHSYLRVHLLQQCHTSSLPLKSPVRKTPQQCLTSRLPFKTLTGPTTTMLSVLPAIQRFTIMHHTNSERPACHSFLRSDLQLQSRLSVYNSQIFPYQILSFLSFVPARRTTRDRQGTYHDSAILAAFLFHLCLKPLINFSSANHVREHHNPAYVISKSLCTRQP